MKERNNAYYDRLRKGEWKYTADFGPSCRSRYNIMRGLVKKYSNPKASLLDIGCGSGNLLSVLKKSGFENIYGSDFSNESVSLNSQKFGTRIFYADIREIKFFEGRIYDVVICSDVLEHIQDDKTAVKNIGRILNDNGILIISVPYNMKYWSSHDSFSGHVRRYESNELESIISENGFVILDSFGWGNLLYSLYFNILIRMKPHRIMGQGNKFFKKLLSRFFVWCFVLEYLSVSKKNAKRLFIAARKSVI